MKISELEKRLTVTINNDKAQQERANYELQKQL